MTRIYASLAAVALIAAPSLASAHSHKALTHAKVTKVAKVKAPKAQKVAKVTKTTKTATTAAN